MVWDGSGGAGVAGEPGAGDAWRGVAVGVLNLTGLGLGYGVLRRWWAMAGCWAATGVLLIAALPADPNGVPGGLVAGYLCFLAVVALHGTACGRRTPPARPERSGTAMAVALALLVVPAGGVAWYDGARDEAVQRMLLGRLAAADRLVREAAGRPFGAAEPGYRAALAGYRDLAVRHPGSRAAALVPARLAAYYRTVAAPYARKDYCGAVAPLTFLRTVPATVGRATLGPLAGWPDGRLASALYACGAAGLGEDAAVAEKGGDLNVLLTAFPRSPQAGRVEPAVRAAMGGLAGRLAGSDPCPAAKAMGVLRGQAAALPGGRAGVAGALDADADRAAGYVRTGTFACGVAEYKQHRFSAAAGTMNGYVADYPHDAAADRAHRIAIAATVAEQLPAAGKHLPTTASGGGIPVTILNDSPDPVEILYTGPVTGSFTLKACGGCTTYFSDEEARTASCEDPSRDYPRKTVHLPPGTTYFLHKSTGDSDDSPGGDKVTLRSGTSYTECAYQVDDSDPFLDPGLDDPYF